MRWSIVRRIAALQLPLAWACTTWSADAPQSSPPQPRPSITVWETGGPAPPLLTPAALAGQNDWTALTQGQSAGPSKGDVVLSNGRVVAVLRRHDAALEVHAVKPGDTAP